MNSSKILFFINGPVPNAEDREEAAQLRALNPKNKVVFRNANWATIEEGVEPFFDLRGCVPDFYLDFQKRVKEIGAVVETDKPEGYIVDTGVTFGKPVESVNVEEEASAAPPVSKTSRVRAEMNKKKG